LALDEERVILLYESALEEAKYKGKRRPPRRAPTPEAAPSSSTPRSITDTPPSLPRVAPSSRAQQRAALAPMASFLVGVASLAVIGYVVFALLSPAVQRALENNGEDNGGILTGIRTREPTPTSLFSLIPTFTQVYTPSAPLANVAQQYDGEGVLVTIEMRQRTWVRMIVDGVEQYAGIATPGTVIEYRGANQIVVTASNAAALGITYNGQPQRVLGGRGQRVDVTFDTQTMSVTASGDFAEPTLVATPTQITPTPLDLNALSAQLTPSATATIEGAALVPTATPLPSDTHTFTPSVTFTPSITPTPTNTPGPSPSNTDTPTATQILPIRQPISTATPSKTPSA
jgi:hypothetical protein